MARQIDIPRLLDNISILEKHFAGEHLGLRDNLSRYPVSKPEPVEHYLEQYVTICVLPFFEFINSYGSINESKKERSTSGPIRGV